ncbi:ATP-dependent RNA helicase DDX24 [Leguminivora glycinivorella]|uniref:ATP-dependent RNA helicase DDX24 n=1 Tax=Leguminivora glycinivorella TaxID=1035111 RepID=UPI00200C18C1|nr:ATP-dependent RNA helicase DDX24 [Leguminivora glycinivorella]
MSKKLKDLKWQSVALDGFPASMGDKLQGFIGLEECTSYSLDKERPRNKKKKEQKKRKNTTSVEETVQKQIPNKKQKLSNGFIVETCDAATPSLNNEDRPAPTENKRHNTPGASKKSKSVKKLGESVSEVRSELTSEDMLSWAEFKLPEEITRALMELGFKQPTKIQQLSLPAAIHGRRDILGAAETGSGKTLAFGLPILTGILKLKEKAQAKGLDVYEIPYKKSSKKKPAPEPQKKQIKKKKNKIKKKEIKKDTSSEDGYSSGEDEKEIKEDQEELKDNDDDDFLEEIEVPVKKRELSTDEGNDSDDSAEYVHLSDIFNDDDSESDEDGNERVGDEKSNGENEGSGDETESQDEVDGDEEGIGCVKVIDNIELPGTEMVRTGSPLYALILTPTRELAMQISQHLKAVAKYTGVRIATVVGGMASVKQERELSRSPEVVVATPGRLWELTARGQPHLQQLPCVKFLAIDETDRMIERNHFEELHPLLERLNSDEAQRSSRQNFVFSATLTLVHDLPAHMKGKKVTKRGKIINRKIEKMTPKQKIARLVALVGMTEPKVVDITADNLGTAETLTECRIACAFEHKDAYLYYILKRHPGRTIVFCNAIGCVQRLAQLLSLLKCRPLQLHANLQQRQRLKNLERFRDDPHGVLIATDVVARGLDIPDVDHVIHYQVPRTAENYVHRSGRTARASKEGLTILMMEPQEAYRYAKLCITLNKKSSLPTFPVPPLSLDSLKALVNTARQLDALLLKRKRAAQALGWREKAARDMDMIVDDDDAPVKELDPGLEKAVKVTQKQLNAMLARPVFPRGFSFKYPTLNEPTALAETQDNALQVMKKALESGELKREKRKSKNASLLKLQKTLKKK